MVLIYSFYSFSIKFIFKYFAASAPNIPLHQFIFHKHNMSQLRLSGQMLYVNYR